MTQVTGYLSWEGGRPPPGGIWWLEASRPFLQLTAGSEVRWSERSAQWKAPTSPRRGAREISGRPINYAKKTTATRGMAILTGKDDQP